MLSQRTGLAALALTTVLAGGALVMDDASAKGRCASGQILKVSSHTCISRAAAIKQGIIGGKHKEKREASRHSAHGAKQAAEAKAPATADRAEEDKATTAVARTAPKEERKDARVAAPSNAMASADPSGVRIEVLKTEPRPTPAILTPTWPYGELAAFPRRTSP